MSGSEISQFSWYTVVDFDMPFEQGDILFDFPIQIPSVKSIDALGGETVGELNVETYKVILMTQSCDLRDGGPDDDILFCPCYDYRELSLDHPDLGTKDGWSKLIKGRFTHLTLLNQCEIEGFEAFFQVVDLKKIFTVSKSYVDYFIRKDTKQRIRLLPPYREYLAQAFARQFMRIGLPLDIPPKYPLNA